jgi:alkylation response protein AidB-like acyl-CoA dehydrogenase
MIFELNEEQRVIQETVRRFAEHEIAPHAEEWDEHEHFPRELLRPLGELGLSGLYIPEQYGGSELGRLNGALAFEQLGRADMATGTWLSVHNMVAGLIYRFGSEEQRQRWLPGMTSGDLLGAFSLSEAGSGSDAASLQCSARRDNDTYVLNGTKMWVTSGGEADVYTVMVRTAPGRSAEGTSCLVVEKGTPGFSAGKTERKMGLHSSPTRELIFDQCRVPATHLLGAEGDGIKIALSSLDGGRINIGAISIGVAQAALETATSYARERRQFNHPIGFFQGVQFLLADMAMKVEAARLLVYQAAYKMDTGADAGMYAAMAKCFATDAAMAVTTDAVQVLGGAGYVRDYPVERYMRDVKVGQIFEGTNQIQRLVIARALLGEAARG